MVQKHAQAPYPENGRGKSAYGGKSECWGPMAGWPRWTTWRRPNSNEFVICNAGQAKTSIEVGPVFRGYMAVFWGRDSRVYALSAFGSVCAG